MTKQNPSSLKVSAEKYRMADLVIAAAFLLAGIIGGYYAISEGVRDYWLLLVVGIVGAILMFRRSRST